MTDQTTVKKAVLVAKKVADYQAKETEKLTQAISKLARGELDVKLAVALGDDDTHEAKNSASKQSTRPLPEHRGPQRPQQGSAKSVKR